MDINPQGRRVILSYDIADESYGSDFNFNEYTLDWREYIPLYKRHTLALRAMGGFCKGHNLSQGAFLLGGMENLRGYAINSFRGDKMGFWSAEYRFPILQDMGKKLSFFYLDRLYGMVFVDSGNAWFEGKLSIGDFDTDAVIIFKNLCNQRALRTFLRGLSKFFDKRNFFCYNTKFIRGRGVAWFNTWPCQGQERGFKSLRPRQNFLCENFDIEAIK